MSERAHLTADYDADSDVLYITSCANGPAVAREDEPGMVWRYRTDDGKLVGLTLIEFAGYWSSQRARVVEQMMTHFHISEGAASTLLESVH
jgi:uncharacterized protein YuzE